MWGHLSASLIRGYDGAPTHVVAHVQDITKQKEASLLFESTFERSMVPKIVFDDARRLIDLNSAAAKLLGTTHDDAIGLPLYELVGAEALAELWEPFLRAGTIEGETWLDAR